MISIHNPPVTTYFTMDSDSSHGTIETNQWMDSGKTGITEYTKRTTWVAALAVMGKPDPETYEVLDG